MANYTMIVGADAVTNVAGAIEELQGSAGLLSRAHVYAEGDGVRYLLSGFDPASDLGVPLNDGRDLLLEGGDCRKLRLFVPTDSIVHLHWWDQGGDDGFTVSQRWLQADFLAGADLGVVDHITMFDANGDELETLDYEGEMLEFASDNASDQVVTFKSYTAGDAVIQTRSALAVPKGYSVHLTISEIG